MEARGAGAAGRGRSFARSLGLRGGRAGSGRCPCEERGEGEGREEEAARGGAAPAGATGPPGAALFAAISLSPPGLPGAPGRARRPLPLPGPAPRSGRRRRSPAARPRAAGVAGDARAERGWRFRRAGHAVVAAAPGRPRAAAAAELVPWPRGGKVAGAGRGWGARFGPARPGSPPGPGPGEGGGSARAAPAPPGLAAVQSGGGC